MFCETELGAVASGSLNRRIFCLFRIPAGRIIARPSNCEFVISKYATCVSFSRIVTRCRVTTLPARKGAAEIVICKEPAVFTENTSEASFSLVHLKSGSGPLQPYQIYGSDSGLVKSINDEADKRGNFLAGGGGLKPARNWG